LSLVSATLFLGALRFEKAWRRLLAMLTISFVLLTLGNATDLASLKLAAGCGGIATGTLVTCAGLVLFFKAIYGRRGFVPVHA
jgi:succinate-acetate transporter protein